MFGKIRVIFSIPELRQKILLTLSLLAVYRIGWAIPLPIVDAVKMNKFWETQSEGIGALMNQMTLFSGTQLEQITIFGLGIMPYISASIIFQLLATVYEPLEKLQKEGESGRKKINEYTRYATIIICLIQSYFYIIFITSASHTPCISDAILVNGELPRMWMLTAVLTMTAGTAFLMWLGEQIDEYGIGNGISLLIMAGIIANLPRAFASLAGKVFDKNYGVAIGGNGADQMGVERLLVLAALFVAVVVGVIYVTKGQRRIPTQTAKHVRGRKVFGGNRQYLPLKVNQAGVMPIIFASSLLLFPAVLFQTLHQMFPTGYVGGFLQWCIDIFQNQTFSYILLYIALIFFFCYFWTAVTFNPKDMAENLKNYGTFIPGYRPGRRTADYLEKVMIRITYVGAAFLALIAIIPNFVSTALLGNFDGSFVIAGFFGGTSLLIVVSVIIDLVDKIDSHLIMRNYKGLLDKSTSTS